jgi:hypothetical protein
MATITFDGPNKKITIGYDAAITTTTAEALYSRWKEWVQAGNAQFEPAFGESVGGNELGGGVSIAGYYFIRNDLGWTISPSNQSYEIRIGGDLYPQNAAIPFLNPAVGSFTVTFVLQRSAASYISEVGTSGLTVAEGNALLLIEKVLRNRRETNPTTGKQRIYDDDGTTVLIEGDLWEDVAGTTAYNGASTKVDRADRMV